MLKCQTTGAVVAEPCWNALGLADEVFGHVLPWTFDHSHKLWFILSCKVCLLLVCLCPCENINCQSVIYCTFIYYHGGCSVNHEDVVHVCGHA